MTPKELQEMVINVAEEAIRDKFDAVRAARGFPRMEKTDLQIAIENSLKKTPAKPAPEVASTSSAKVLVGPHPGAWSTGTAGHPHCLSPEGHLAKQLKF